MKVSGILTLIVGALIGIYAMNMGVSVHTEFGTVNNIGLMNDRQNYLIIAGIAIIAGLIMLILSSQRRSLITIEPLDPFDAIDRRDGIDRKRYAISIGVARSGGTYEFAGEAYADLEAAVSAAEAARQPRQLSPDEIAKLEQDRVAQINADDRLMGKIVGGSLALMVISLSLLWLFGTH